MVRVTRAIQGRKRGQRMTDKDIVRIVRALVGSITPIGDSCYDGKVLDNICLLGNVVDILICRIGNVAMNSYNSNFVSVETCGKRSLEILSNINKNIEQYHAIGTIEELQTLKEKAVLIMDMPASCGKCQLKLVGEYLDVRCAIGHRVIPITYGRPEWCPLKQISTGRTKTYES